LATSNTSFYYLILAFAVVASVGTMVILRGRLGRLLGALGDSPSALETGGVSLNLLKVTVFSLSAFMAGIAGALIGASQLFAVGSMFTTIGSLTLFALIIFVPGQTPWYAINCAFGFAVLPILIPGANTAEYLQTLFGVSAVLVAFQRGRGKQLEAVPGPIRHFIDRVGGRSTADHVVSGEVAVIGRTSYESVLQRQEFESALAREQAAASDGLVVGSLSVRFGGLHAVADLSLSAPRKGITGLIGPNGAGKSTTFNACCGLVTPSAGQVVLGGTDMSGLSASRRARLGLGRTFQQMQLYESATVQENVAMGCEARLIGRNPVGQFFASPLERRRTKERTSSALRACGLETYSQRSVVELSTGIRRLVELARVLAGDFDFLLLDEPSSGLNNIETERFGQLLLEYTSAEHACGILLVEHDMSLVMEVCSYIYVMDFGKLIFEGTPEQVKGSPVVQAAYLGAEDAELVPDEESVELENVD
jgi:ABC-type branched-subunit amino acid transport system ATPase component